MKWQAYPASICSNFMPQQRVLMSQQGEFMSQRGNLMSAPRIFLTLPLLSGIMEATKKEDTRWNILP